MKWTENEKLKWKNPAECYKYLHEEYKKKFGSLKSIKYVLLNWYCPIKHIKANKII